MRWFSWCILALVLAPRAAGQAQMFDGAGNESAVTPVAHACPMCPQCQGQPCRCPQEVCYPTVQQVKETRSCWVVTCEKVCIPAVRMPWEPGGSGLTIFNCLRRSSGQCACGQSGCAGACGVACGIGDVCQPVCGQVRNVHVLDSKDYEVTKCECKWEIRRLPPCGAPVVLSEPLTWND